MASSDDEKATVSEEVKILKNEADWAEKQQLENEEEMIRLKTVIEQLSEDLQKTHLQLSTQEFLEQKLKSTLEDKEKECQNIKSELKSTSNELYQFKTKICVISKSVSDMEKQLSELDDEKNLALKNYDDLKEQIEKKNEETIHLQEAVKAADTKIQSLENEMLALADVNGRLEAKIVNQRQDFFERQTALEEREQRLEDKAVKIEQLNTLEEEIVRLHASNKDLRDKLSQKNCGVPIVFLNKGNKTIGHQHIKNTVRNLEETNEELRKQVILAQSKICSLEKEMQQCGIRPAKRHFQQHTVSSQSKQRVPFTPASSGKENANAPPSSSTALMPFKSPTRLFSTGLSSK